MSITLFPISGTSSVSAHVYRSPRTRAIWTSVLLVVTVITSARNMYMTAEAEKRLDDMTYLSFLVALATTIVFLLWIYRASQNLHSLGALGQRFSPGWAVGWWFIPIMFFFRPYQVMVEIWKGSTPRATREATFDWKTESVSALLPCWWASWIAGAFISIVWVSGEASGGTNSGWQVELLGEATYICTAVLAIAVVWRTTQHQDEKNQKMIG